MTATAPLTSRQHKLSEALAVAAVDFDAARWEWETAIYRAVQGGISTRAVAAVAGCSHQSVANIHAAVTAEGGRK
jgi:hypothetical protein